jgi:hypothetical protein
MQFLEEGARLLQTSPGAAGLDVCLPLTLVAPVVGGLVTALIWQNRRLDRYTSNMERQLDEFISDARRRDATERSQREASSG